MNPAFAKRDEEPGEFVTAGHLGGYVAGGDPQTFCPELWRWLVQVRGVRSVVDVGCGDGAAVRYFAEELGLAHVIGVDGVWQPDSRIAPHDYQDGPLAVPPVDLVWSCEFVEHVEERYVPNFLETFRAGRIVAMTHALPGQPGHHHVNCREPDYWIGALAAVGYAQDVALTADARALVDPTNYFRRTGLVFRRPD